MRISKNDKPHHCASALEEVPPNAVPSKAPESAHKTPGEDEKYSDRLFRIYNALISFPKHCDAFKSLLNKYKFTHTYIDVRVQLIIRECKLYPMTSRWYRFYTPIAKIYYVRATPLVYVQRWNENHNSNSPWYQINLEAFTQKLAKRQ